MHFVRTVLRTKKGKLEGFKVHCTKLEKLYLIERVSSEKTQEEIDAIFNKLEARLEEYINISHMFKHLRD